MTDEKIERLQQELHVRPLNAQLRKSKKSAGMGDMIIFCSNNGLREPDFSLADGFVVTIWRMQSALLPTGVVASHTPVKTPDRILELLEENPELTLVAFLARNAVAIPRDQEVLRQNRSCRLCSG